MGNDGFVNAFVPTSNLCHPSRRNVNNNDEKVSSFPILPPRIGGSNVPLCSTSASNTAGNGDDVVNVNNKQMKFHQRRNAPIIAKSPNTTARNLHPHQHDQYHETNTNNTKQNNNKSTIISKWKSIIFKFLCRLSTMTMMIFLFSTSLPSLETVKYEQQASLPPLATINKNIETPSTFLKQIHAKTSIFVRPPSASALILNTDTVATVATTTTTTKQRNNNAVSTFDNGKREVVLTRGLKRQGRIMDLTQTTLNPQDTAKIMDVIQSVERDTGTEVQIVITDDIDYRNYNPKRFATMLFNDWEIGPRDKNNGVLLLVVLKQRRMEIEIGRGLNNYMGKSWCTTALERDAFPSFKRGEYSKGMYEITKTVANQLRVVERLRAVDAKKESALIINDRRKVELSIGALFIYATCYSIYSTISDLLRVPRELRFKKCEVCGVRSWSRNPILYTIEEASTAQKGLKEIKCICENCDYEVRYTRETPMLHSPRELNQKGNCEKCGGMDWYVPKDWIIVKEASSRQRGWKEMICECRDCGNEIRLTREIPTYYDSSCDSGGDSGGGGGGGDSDGGGGGGSW